MVFDADEAGLNEETSIEGLAYPNPAVDVVTVSVNAEGNATLNIEKKQVKDFALR